MSMKFKAFILSLALIFNTFAISAFAVAEGVIINSERIDQGIVQIAYQNPGVEKIKVMIEKDTDKYTYDLNADGSNESFPLQLGNGVYKVSVLQNIEGNRYSCLATEELVLELSDPNLVYLNSIQNIELYDGESVANEAAMLTQGIYSDEEKIKIIHDYIVHNFSYDYNKLSEVKSGYIPDNAATLSTKGGICYDFASLFAAMVRSQGIPCKLVKGYAQNVEGYHAWNEVLVNGSWMVIDTSVDLQLNTTDIMEKDAGDYTKVYEY